MGGVVLVFLFFSFLSFSLFFFFFLGGGGLFCFIFLSIKKLLFRSKADVGEPFYFFITQIQSRTIYIMINAVYHRLYTHLARFLLSFFSFYLFACLLAYLLYLVLSFFFLPSFV